ncbi:hypothetical protein ACFOWZ_04110 [Lentzea rhizosphaerae]|uniref:Uncharacterized protein n=1 Tax=Lentzea rhizosphaerae TaxID=2041025 RepID=A0ABV8BLB4_9PSEU|nr:hypothetical protein [Lentzea rhizosphaerae]
MRIDHDGPCGGHDLEDVYLTHMRAARDNSFAATVRQMFTERRAADLRTACWAAAQLAEQHSHGSDVQALAWARRCCHAYAEYRAAVVPAWVRAMAALTGVALPIDDVARENEDPLHVAVQRVRWQWAELRELSFG